ncbi:alpha/beta hydrolase [Adhaeribacter pallidiroseus]|uniref:Endo-1,4-beta-xylanase n=1 Tax=Adhaeribacter pallidiroseus TaxID=2072847 RepID=A0A369QIL0_9BACT|nr:alpha/beta hydrolase [Adhaeribacter pallidiroseus]RDC62128.1 Endo-1,4-beta-xylanase [Adhaeribacter pallidiroseus]
MLLKAFSQIWASCLLLHCLSTVAQAQNNGLKIPLWPQGAPGFENRRNEPEQAKDWWVKNIHNPSVTVFLPPQTKATGTAVIIMPGGGHRELVFNAEGVEPAAFLNNLGIAAIVLKYRLGREENSPYNVEKHPRQDAERAIRLVRSKASVWGIDPMRIGVLGFSAGGEVANMVAYGPGNGDPKATDPIDRLNSKPNFLMLIYPGPGFIPAAIPTDAPPVFLITANNDPCCSGSTIELLQKYRAAKVPVEAHILAQGSHGFNMGQRSKLNAVSSWPQRLADWLSDSNLLLPAGSAQAKKPE